MAVAAGFTLLASIVATAVIRAGRPAAAAGPAAAAVPGKTREPAYPDSVSRGAE
jgi:hypothetical protein